MMKRSRSVNAISATEVRSRPLPITELKPAAVVARERKEEKLRRLNEIRLSKRRRRSLMSLPKLFAPSESASVKMDDTTNNNDNDLSLLTKSEPKSRLALPSSSKHHRSRSSTAATLTRSISSPSAISSSSSQKVSGLRGGGSCTMEAADYPDSSLSATMSSGGGGGDGAEKIQCNSPVINQHQYSNSMTSTSSMYSSYMSNSSSGCLFPMDSQSALLPVLQICLPVSLGSVFGSCAAYVSHRSDNLAGIVVGACFVAAQFFQYQTSAMLKDFRSSTLMITQNTSLSLLRGWSSFRPRQQRTLSTLPFGGLGFLSGRRSGDMMCPINSQALLVEGLYAVCGFGAAFALSLYRLTDDSPSSPQSPTSSAAVAVAASLPPSPRSRVLR